MTIPIQLGVPQLILLLVAIVGITLLISSLMTLLRGSRSVFEDDDGRRFYSRRYRRVRWGRGAGGLFLLLFALSLLWVTSLVQTYVGLTGDIKVAQIRATKVANIDHMMSVDLQLFDKDGKQTGKGTYLILGDQWMLRANVLKFPGWMNLLGVHSGYKVTRLQGLYEAPQDEENLKHTVVVLNGGDDDFFKTVYKQAWSSPFVEAGYASAAIVPADGMTYDVLVSQTGLYAKPANK